MNWTAWQPWLIGAVVVGLVTRYIVRALFADRAHGRPRCFRCGHPFADGQGMTCPECGWTARTPADRLRTRRHWGKAGIALLVLLGIAMGVRLAAVGGDPLALLPDRALVMLLPIDPPGISGSGPVAEAIRSRIASGTFDDARLPGLVDRLVSGDDGARPPSLSWRRRYGDLAAEVRARHGGPEDPIGRRFLDLPPVIEIEVPERWPTDQPVPARLMIEDYWPLGTEAIVRLDEASGAEEATTEVMTIGYRNFATIRRRHSFMLPPTEAWPSDGSWPVTIRSGTTNPERVVLETEATDRDWRDRRTLELDVTIDRPTETPPLVLRPWDGDATAETAITAVFDRGLWRWDGVRRPYAIRFDPRQLAIDPLEGVFFGMVADIVERTPDGETFVRRRHRLWMSGGAAGSERGTAGWAISEEDLDGLAGAFDATNESTWTMRVTGDEALARLAAVAAGRFGDQGDRWWSGTVEFDLPISTAEGRPFVRMWFDPEGVRFPAENPADHSK